MKSKTKERIYLAITVVCLLMCAVLLMSVFLDRPVFGAQSVEHLPAMRPLSTEIPTNGITEGLPAAELPAGGAEGGEDAEVAVKGVVITEEQLARIISDALPDGFPARTVRVELEDGVVELALLVRRDDLSDYLRTQGVELGFKRSLAMRLLPKELDLDMTLAGEQTDSGFHLNVRSIEINDEEIDLTGLPTELFTVFDSAIHAGLQATGYAYSGVVFTRDAIVLQ